MSVVTIKEEPVEDQDRYPGLNNTESSDNNAHFEHQPPPPDYDVPALPAPDGDPQLQIDDEQNHGYNDHHGPNGNEYLPVEKRQDLNPHALDANQIEDIVTNAVTRVFGGVDSIEMLKDVITNHAVLAPNGKEQPASSKAKTVSEVALENVVPVADNSPESLCVSLNSIMDHCMFTDEHIDYIRLNYTFNHEFRCVNDGSRLKKRISSSV